MKHRARISTVALLTTLALVGSAARSEAVVLIAPTDNVAVPADLFFGGVELDSIYHVTASPFLGASGAPQWTGTLSSAVYRNDAGFLDFYYQISNTTLAPEDDILTRTTHVDFSGFLTDVYYITTPGSFIGCAACPGGFFADGTEDPDTADRQADSTVGFDFAPTEVGEGVDPGEVSFVYVIRTDARQYEPGGSTMSNGGTTNVVTFQPTIRQVPEPGSLGLFALGLLASAAGLRRRWTR
jgi:hypothetical protein